jgi:N6-adenosine-specific RNA methylase IME4
VLAAEFKLRAEWKLGKLLEETVRKGGDPKLQHETSLPDGVSRIQSHRWQLVSSVEEEAFEQVLAKARDSQNEITTAAVIKLAKKMRAEQAPRHLRETCTLEDLEVLVSRGAKFSTFYADPPWQYGNQATENATDRQYITMPFDEIAALPVSKLTNESAHLHLWVTSSFLQEGLDLIREWGFEYKSSFVWCKNGMGMGNYWRITHEFLLLGIRGGLRFSDHSLLSYLYTKRARHSEKPTEVRSFIERASPEPYLELFGRDAVEGWTVWGNEVERGLFTRTAERLTV